MAEEVERTTEDRPRDTVVVEREGSRTNGGLIALAVIIILLLLFFLLGNPFSSGNDTSSDVNVDVPTPNVNVDTPDVNQQ